MLRSSLGVTVEHAEETHPGLDPDKQTNEDCCGSRETPLGLLFVLSDGMGGHSAGELASQAAVATVLNQISAAEAGSGAGRALMAAIEAANDAVCAIGQGRPAVMRPGSTCVAALFGSAGLYVGHVGDSRAYLASGGQVTRLTRDHSVVGELIAAGAITPEQGATHPSAHQITRALGMQQTVAVDVSGAIPVRKGDLVLLCSDGLTDLVSDLEILAVLQRGPDVAAACRGLVTLALERGGHDNVTVQVMRVIEAPDTAHTIVDTIVESTVESRPSGGRAALPGQAAPTVVDASKTLPEAGHLSETPPMTERVRVAPTMVDHPERATPIAPFPPAGAMAPAGAPAPSQPRPPASLPPDAPARRGANMLVGSLGLVLAIVLFVLLWWLFGALRH